jgi:hypothetical protein
MERLTEYKPYFSRFEQKEVANLMAGDICSLCGKSSCDGKCPITDAIDRLAAYEETGKTPDEIADMMRWISVEERLPEHSGLVLAYYDCGTCDVTFHRYGGGWYGDCEDGHVTHWMPLPQPPKEAHNDQN